MTISLSVRLLNHFRLFKFQNAEGFFLCVANLFVNKGAAVRLEKKKTTTQKKPHNIRPCLEMCMWRVCASDD